MKREEVEYLEKITGKLEGLHREISTLSKKSSVDALNIFKLKMLNSALTTANAILQKKYKPIDGFDFFDEDDVPSNSDAAVVLTLYLEELERYRADNIVMRSGVWVYKLSNDVFIRTSPPRKIK
ncbi:hypothetical protein QBK99_13310 [Corticibacterium sp. UT-5YL-CI-8]|nr:hypothetical protein [Tianweitania sp. UT-5YL-CI-8]